MYRYKSPTASACESCDARNADDARNDVRLYNAFGDIGVACVRCYRRMYRDYLEG